MKLILHGACGGMGRALRRLAAHTLPEAELVLVDANAVPGEAYRALSEYDGPADCIIDFSHHSATTALLDYAQRRGLPAVIGTTGQTPAELSAIRQASRLIPVLLASNLSMGVLVLQRLARQAARAFPDADVELVEIHHNRKQDVPSGTALTLANAMLDARGYGETVIGRHENGRRKPGQIGIHSLRMGSVVGIHEIHISTGTQTLTLRHEAHDRALFAEGALQAAEFLTRQPAGFYGVEDVLDAM